jgi:dihydroorotate dehydrogenase
MIKLSNGHVFEYMVSSGALGYDGQGWPHERLLTRLGKIEPSLFTSVTKTLTFYSCSGNGHLFRCVRFIPGGVVNAVALRNPGFDWWCEIIGPKVNSSKIPLAASIFGTPAELAEMAERLEDYDLVGIEINASCPNTDTDILENTVRVIASCEAVKRVSRQPIILKISVVHDVERIVKETESLVEALAINSVPWSIVFPERESPLAHFGGGGVSGKAAQACTWDLVSRLSELTDIPVIGPSVWNYCDLAEVRKRGARAIGLGSIFLRYPWRPTSFVRKEQKTKNQRV